MYRDDDFESSEGSAALAKVTVSASGKLPPLSGSYPYGADEKSLSQSFHQSKDGKGLSSRSKDRSAREAKTSLDKTGNNNLQEMMIN